MSHMHNRDSNKPRRQQRQAEAKARQEAYSLLTTKAKLAKLDAGDKSREHVPYTAERQRARLFAAVEASKQEHAQKVEAEKKAIPAKAARNDKKAQKAHARKEAR